MGLRSICQDPAKSHPARPWFHELFGFAFAAVQTCHPFEINGVALLCALTVPAGLLETLIGKAAIGDIEWNRGGRQFKAIYWTVPMNYELQVPGSVVPMTILGNANRIDQRVMAVVYSNSYCIGRSFDAARHLSNSYAPRVPADDNKPNDTRFTPEAVQQAGITQPAANRAA